MYPPFLNWPFLDDARQIVEKYIKHYNTVRLNSAIGYATPADKLNGRDQEIFKERGRKLEAARELRKQKRQQTFSEIRHSGEADITLNQAAWKSNSD
ncbi:integrase core domain-containing protein [Oryzomonas sp.]|uniref:integrase core domain-containing protein n=1 Tax=Oryzomonas sp. TaxID=2855186 RepID=UPI0038D3A6EA